MAYMIGTSEHALASAIMTELHRLGETRLHDAINLSCSAKILANGIKRCTVQLECKAGCGYLFQAFGEEADILQQKTATIQTLLSDGTRDTSPKSLLEDLLLLFPEFTNNSRRTPQCAKELTV